MFCAFIRLLIDKTSIKHKKRHPPETDPELKGAFLWPPDGGLLRQYNKKRDLFCASRVTYDANGQKPGVVLARNAQFQKSRMTPATAKPAQTRQEFIFGIIFGPVDPNTTRGHR